MENESKQNGELRIEVIKKRPKKNAKKYELSTVSEIFDAMEDVKMFNKFLKEFKSMMIMSISVREMMKIKHPESELIKLESFTWIND